MSQPSHTLPATEPLPAPGAGGPEPRVGLTPVSLLIVLIVLYLLARIQLVLVLVLLSLIFATIIEKPVARLERRRLPRGLAILTVYVGIIGTIVLAGILIAPTIQKEADRFREEAPAQLRELRDDWRRSDSSLLNTTGADLLNRAIAQIDNPTAPPEELTVGIVTGIGGGVIGLFSIFIIAFYYLMEKQFLRRIVLLQINPGARGRVDRVWDDVEAQVGRWMRGQLTLCLIIGTMSLIGYGVMGVRFWPLLGLWAGLTEAIPIVGPWLGGIPAVIMAMTQGFDKAVMVAGFVVALQLTENAILVPRVMKGAVGLTPLTVFLAILAGTEFLGIPGALLAIPLAAGVQVVVADYLRQRHGAGRSLEPMLPTWRWMRGARGGALVVPPPMVTEPPEPVTTPPAPAPSTPGWSNQAFAQVGGKAPTPEEQ
jgi:predicted PurR-regulated permease PerM